MLLLEHDGWEIVPWIPRSKVKPIDFEAELIAEIEKLYFNDRSVEIRAPYLHCVLRGADLPDAGLPLGVNH